MNSLLSSQSSFAEMIACDREMMNFEEFQNRARLYVLGALEPAEMKDVEQTTKEFGQKAEDFIQECYALCEAFTLSLRPAKSSALLKEHLMAMVRERQRH